MFVLDADVMGLWANIESQVYKAGLTGNTSAGANGAPGRQMTGDAYEHGGLDGYQQEFVANIER